MAALTTLKFPFNIIYPTAQSVNFWVSNPTQKLGTQNAQLTEDTTSFDQISNEEPFHAILSTSNISRYIEYDTYIQSCDTNSGSAVWAVLYIPKNTIG